MKGHRHSLKRLLLRNGWNKVVAYGGGGAERPDMTWDTEIRNLLADTEQLWENRQCRNGRHGWDRTTMWA